MAERIFADLILPLAIPNLLTYEISHELAAEAVVGKRVIVQLGRQKYYSALIRKLHREAPQGYEIKPIQGIIDAVPVVGELQLKFWEWIAGYYLCTLGEVMNAALPAALKLQSESRVILNPELEQEPADLSRKEYLVYEALATRQEMTVTEIAQLLHRKSAHDIVRDLIDKKVILLSEEMHDRFKPKTVTHLILGDRYQDEALLQEVFNNLEKRSPKQLHALMTFMKLWFGQEGRKSVLKEELMRQADVTSTAVSALIRKGVLAEEKQVTGRLATGDLAVAPLSGLSADQLECLREIRKRFEKDEAVLLHGVTSSGKTEVYMHLIEEVVRKGKQVLYLLPEIALTAQMINRLRRHFGNSVGVYHSRQNSNERVEVWKAVRNFKPGTAEAQSCQVMLGARSALFLPYTDLGLVIVDEEHDSSYKQHDPAPRYQGRDAALVLAKMHSAAALLGSATPSLETYYNVELQKYGKVELKQRYGGMELPEILVCDLKEAARKRRMQSHFTPELIDAIGKAIATKEQVILFQNRRGFAPVLECANCAWIPQCKNCSVTLTYHKQQNQLKCHYCGYTMNPPSTCHRCGDHHLEIKGFGTEKIEEEIALFFPDAVTARLDLDSTRSRNAFHRIISDFEARRIDILVGTQMVTKGLDFENVSTVGIINADQMLNFPDFRAHERAFQLMSQVSGRSGRKRKRGLVLIQTSEPKHWVISDVVAHDYHSFYRNDLLERKKFNYPPHSRLVEIMMKNKDQDLLNEKAAEFARGLRAQLGNRVVGPHQPLIARIKNLFQKRILVKIGRESSTSKVKQVLRDQISAFHTKQQNRAIQLILDVDPN